MGNLMRHTGLLLPFAAVCGFACSGAEDAPDDAGPRPADTGLTADAGRLPDAGQIDGGGPAPDAGLPPDNKVAVAGRVLRLDSYLAGQEVSIDGAGIQAIGVNGVSPSASEADGAYAVRVPQNGVFILGASKTGYLQTYEQISVAATDLTHDFLLAYQPHVDRIAERFGVDTWGQTFPCHAPRNQGNCRYGLIMGRIVDDGSYDNGTPTPMGDVEKDDFTIRVGGYEDWYTKGPYFFFFNGQPNPNVTSTQRDRGNGAKYQGGLFAYFVEMPVNEAGSKEVEISISSYAGGAQRRYFGPKIGLAFEGAFSWLTVPETGIAPPPNPDPDPPPPPVDVDFATEVYPMFATVDQGGLGCLGCHSSQGGETPSGGLDLYGGAGAAYLALDPANYPQRVNVQNPGASYLLKKPLYEADGNQDHPIFAFFSELDPGYRTIYGWIAGGAVYEGGVPPPPVSFYNDVRPILYADAAAGGAGCRGCHVDGVNVNNAPGGAYFGGTPQELFDVLTNQTPNDNGATGEAYRINKQGNAGYSLVLTNPLLGNAEPHPAKLLQGTQDPRYQTIYRWIQEGYTDDSP
jgi:hypothetical protein